MHGTVDWLGTPRTLDVTKSTLVFVCHVRKSLFNYPKSRVIVELAWAFQYAHDAAILRQRKAQNAGFHFRNTYDKMKKQQQQSEILEKTAPIHSPDSLSFA